MPTKREKRKYCRWCTHAGMGCFYTKECPIPIEKRRLNIQLSPVMIRVFLTGLITVAYCYIWMLLETIIDGKITDRMVDNIIIILFIPIIWMATGAMQRKMTEKRKEQINKKREDTVTIHDIGCKVETPYGVGILIDINAGGGCHVEPLNPKEEWEDNDFDGRQLKKL